MLAKPTDTPQPQEEGTDLREVGCTCEFGCSNCGMSEAMMGACAAWDACPLGRAPNDECVVH